MEYDFHDSCLIDYQLNHHGNQRNLIFIIGLYSIFYPTSPVIQLTLENIQMPPKTDKFIQSLYAEKQLKDDSLARINSIIFNYSLDKTQVRINFDGFVPTKFVCQSIKIIPLYENAIL